MPFTDFFFPTFGEDPFGGSTFSPFADPFGSPSDFTSVLDLPKFGFGETLPEDINFGQDQHIPLESPEMAALRVAIGGQMGQQGSTAGTTAPMGSITIAGVTLSIPVALSLGIAGLSALFGLVAVIDSFTKGNPKTRSVINQMVGAASPEEKQAFQNALQQSGVAGDVLSTRLPMEQGLFQGGVQGLSDIQSLLSPISQTATHLFESEAPGLSALQSGTLAGLPGTAPGITPRVSENLAGMAELMSRGGLPSLDPRAEALIDQLYGGEEEKINQFVFDAMRNSVERANLQGFPGGLDVIAQTPGSALMAPALAEATRARTVLGGQKAGQKLRLAQELPLTGLGLESGRLQSALGAHQNLQNVAGAFSTPLALRGQMAQNVLGLGGNLAGQQIGAGTAGTQNLHDLIRTLTGTGSALTGTRDRATTSETRGASPGLGESFAPLASVLSGAGGAVGGLAQIMLLERILNSRGIM